MMSIKPVSATIIHSFIVVSAGHSGGTDTQNL